MAYWGSLDELPKGYELCDGELVTTPDSSLNGKRKPDLRDSFIKGAVNGVHNVTSDKERETGGQNFKNLDHKHTAGDYVALIGPHGEGSGFFSAVPKSVKAPFHAKYEIQLVSRRSGGQADSGTAVDGESGNVSDPAYKNYDIRPQFVSMFYIIKVK